MRYVDVYLKCTSAFFTPLGLTLIYRNSLQGIGYSILPMLTGAVELLARCIVAWMAKKLGNYVEICLAGPAAWCVAAVFRFSTETAITDNLTAGLSGNAVKDHEALYRMCESK